MLITFDCSDDKSIHDYTHYKTACNNNEISFACVIVSMLKFVFDFIDTEMLYFDSENTKIYLANRIINDVDEQMNIENSDDYFCFESSMKNEIDIYKILSMIFHIVNDYDNHENSTLIFVNRLNEKASKVCTFFVQKEIEDTEMSM